MAETPRHRDRGSLAVSLWVLAVSAAIGFGAVYVTLRNPGNGETVSPQRAGSTTTAQPAAGSRRSPLSVGHMSAFVFKPEPAPVPDLAFLDAAGAPRSLKDWQGRVVLLNLWATWCAPCRKEMPALDRLQTTLANQPFEVVALSVDKTGIDGAKAFLDKIGIQALKLYADPTAKTNARLDAPGMPTTLLIDRDGREIGRLVGPAEWDSAEAIALVRAALGGSAVN